MIPHFIHTLFASFGSTPKERNINYKESCISVESQYLSHFIDTAMNGSYEDIREAYTLYKTYRDFDKSLEFEGLF